jgi:hypothetical protein
MTATEIETGPKLAGAVPAPGRLAAKPISLATQAP